MITASQLKPLRGQAPDIAETERLKSKLATLRTERKPFFLTASEFDEILRWKLRTQYHRTANRRVDNTDALIRTVTAYALNVTHADRDYELELRIAALCGLRGVSVAVVVLGSLEPMAALDPLSHLARPPGGDG